MGGRLLDPAPEVDLVIMAHTNRPVSPVARWADYLNPGAFLDGGRYAVITRNKVELNQFTAGRLQTA